MNEKHSQRPNKEALVKAKGLLVDFQTNDKTMDPETQEALALCLTSIEDLLDENESLWDMLDEMRASEIENYSEEFRQMMDRRLTNIRMLARMKPGLA